MSDRSVVVRFRAEVAGFNAAMAEATASTGQLRKGSEEAAVAAQVSADKAAIAAEKQAAAAKVAAEAQKVAINNAAAAQLKADEQAAKSAQMRADMAGVGTKEQVAAYEQQAIAADAAANTASLAAARVEEGAIREAIAVRASADAQVLAAERAAAAQEASILVSESSMERMATSAMKHTQAWEKAGTAMTMFGAVALVAVGAAVAIFAEFDAKMSQVKTLSHATATEMQTLTTAALTMGQGIGYSASQVADAQIEMVKAGVSVKDMMGGALPGALSLAAAGQISVADATEIATIAMTQFKLHGSDVPHIADLLAAGADKALGGVAELGWALKAGGLEANQFGWSLDETVGTLSSFAQHGLIGETAGTTLKMMLMKLAAPSKEAANEMHQLGISVYDSQGHFVKAADLAGQLHDKMQNLSAAERNAAAEHMFGSRAIQAFNIMYDEGRGGITKWTQAVNDAGFAATQAIGKMDNLKGDLSKLKASFETSMIEMGSSANSFLRPVVKGLTDGVKQFEALPEGSKGAILSISGMTGATALLAGGFLTLTPKIFETVKGFKQLNDDGSKIPGIMGKAAGALALLAAVNIAGGAIDAAYANGKSAAPTITETADAIQKLGQAGNTTNLDGLFKNWDNGIMKKAPTDVNSLADAVRKLTHVDDGERIMEVGKSIVTFGQGQTGVQQVQERFKQLDSTMGQLASNGAAAKAAQSFRLLTTAYEQNGKSAKDALDATPAYRDALMATAQAAGVTTLSQQDLVDWAQGKIPAAMAAAVGATGGYVDASGAFQITTAEQQKALENLGIAADGTVTDLEKLVGALEDAGMIQISTDKAQINAQKALEGINGTIDDNIKKIRDKYKAEVEANTETFTGAGAAEKNAAEKKRQGDEIDRLTRLHIGEARSLDITTDAGKANKLAYDGLAESNMNYAKSLAKNGAGEDAVKEQLQTTYDQLIKQAGQYGVVGTEADNMARKVMGIPPGKSIDVWVKDFTTEALKNIGIKTEGLKDKTINVTVQTNHVDIFDRIVHPQNYDANGNAKTPVHAYGQGLGVYAPGKWTGGPIQRLATGGGVKDLTSGGAIFGAGTKTSDSVPIWASTGEFMESAKAVDHYGLDFMHSINNLTYKPGGMSAQHTFQPPQGGGTSGLSSDDRALIREALAAPRFLVQAPAGVDIEQMARGVESHINWRTENRR